MRRGWIAALAALLSCGTAFADDGDSHRLYDRMADCAVIAITGLPSQSATWDGPCVRGLATGHGTAEFYDKDGSSEAVTADFRDGAILDGKGELLWSDSAHYQGDLVAGQADGNGALVDSQGNRFTGRWRQGAMNGHGTVVWANGDRFEGELVNGKAEGHGIQVWADGRKYDGQWHDDQPDGQGTVTRKDGTQYAAVFVAGKLQPAAAAPSPMPAAAATQAAATPAPPGRDKILAAYTGRTLFGVDRSTVALAAEDNGVLLTITSPDGQVRKLIFTSLGNGMGTIADAGEPGQAIGLFRIASGAVKAEYADGHSELLAPSADGLLLTLKNDTGAQFCAAWYPEGHVFSAVERKAAVAAYAQRLGVADSAAPQNSCAVSAAPPATTAAVRPAAVHRKGSHALAGAPTTPAAALAAAPPVLVKESVVHTIDASPTGDTIDTASSAAPPADETIASKCLKVESDGSYWGFRNHCSYSVQFAYCVLRGTDTMTACGGEGGVPGSVPGNGFGALFSDQSLGERGVDHDFRWIGCRGGAGEVVAHLDQPDPASGHCVRASRALASGN
jgi:hypothetical protein